MKKYDLAYHHKRVQKIGDGTTEGFLDALRKELDRIREESDATSRAVSAAPEQAAP